MRPNIARSGGLASAALALAGVWHAPAALAADSAYLGLLRARDLTPFGFLRLDMRPAHAVVAPVGNWAIEAELAHQNTWALSSGVKKYLDSLGPRRELDATDLAAIRALPGENYLVDLELAQLDMTLHRKFSKHWGGYVVLSAVSYSGGFLDGAIEQFHEAFSVGPFGRPDARRYDTNWIADLKSVQLGFLEMPTQGGLLDPTVGVRYSVAQQLQGWNLVLEAAAKLPIRNREPFLSTGRTDFGVQATLQRFSDHHAWYASAAGVYYDGRTDVTPTPARVIPTLILGYERRLSPRTNLVLQGYVSDGIYTRHETDLSDLLDTKYQLSLGIYRRMGRGVVTFAITENIQNLNNTPDVGLLLGWAYSPVLELKGD
jgi:hypothetical protein